MKRLLVFLLTAIMLLSYASIFANAATLEFKTGITPDPESPLYQKKVLFVGDSITEARCEWNQGKTIVGWPGRIIEGNDMLGINKGFSPKFLRRYADLHTIMTEAVSNYIEDVKSCDFPNENEQY